jgi:hypothetical protein
VVSYFYLSINIVLIEALNSCDSIIRYKKFAIVMNWVVGPFLGLGKQKDEYRK